MKEEPNEWWQLFQELTARLGALQGVETAAIMSGLPGSGPLWRQYLLDHKNTTKTPFGEEIFRSLCGLPLLFQRSKLDKVELSSTLSILILKSNR